jgi:hypothetical protein
VLLPQIDHGIELSLGPPVGVAVGEARWARQAVWPGTWMLGHPNRSPGMGPALQWGQMGEARDGVGFGWAMSGI